MNVTRLQKEIPFLLKPLGRIYAQIMRLRANAYNSGIKKVWKPDVPCISVGNICSGGTGKTPVVSAILEWAEAKALNPVVLTRGYKAKPDILPYIVRQDSLPAKAGDEPLFLAKSHPQSTVVVDPVRVRSGKMAMKKISPDIFVLDDGFQHMAIGRDVNLVLMRAEDLGKHWNQVIPGGDWREGTAALERADAFLIKTTTSQKEKLAELAQARLKKYNKPIFLFYYKYSGVERLDGSEFKENFNGEPYMLFTGVGSPQQVLECVVDYFGCPPSKSMLFPDHHRFTKKDIEKLKKIAEGSHILATEKDAVKLAPLAPDLWSIKAGIEFAPHGQTNFFTWLEELLPGLTRNNNV